MTGTELASPGTECEVRTDAVQGAGELAKGTPWRRRRPAPQGGPQGLFRAANDVCLARRRHRAPRQGVRATPGARTTVDEASIGFDAAQAARGAPAAPAGALSYSHRRWSWRTAASSTNSPSTEVSSASAQAEADSSSEPLISPRMATPEIDDTTGGAATGGGASIIWCRSLTCRCPFASRRDGALPLGYGTSSGAETSTPGAARGTTYCGPTG
jgi:hypothetical protein